LKPFVYADNIDVKLFLCLIQENLDNKE